MGKSLSLDIRERVVTLVREGLSCHEAARRLRILAASAVRIMQRPKRTGGVRAAPQGGPRRRRGSHDRCIPAVNIAAAGRLSVHSAALVPHLPRSSLHRCFQRHGISRLPDMDGDKPKR